MHTVLAMIPGLHQFEEYVPEIVNNDGAQVLNWVSKHTYSPQNSLKIKNIFRKPFPPNSAVSDWLWDLN